MNNRCFPVLLLASNFLILSIILKGQDNRITKTDDGIILKLNRLSSDAPHLVRLQALTDKIIHVTSTPADSFSTEPSLMALEKKTGPMNWQFKEIGEQAILSTAFLSVSISAITGAIVFTNNDGKVMLQERKNDGKTFTPITLDGDKYYELKQVFESPLNEAFYGLGQHQGGLMNYKGYQVELSQNNTEVAVPFLVSSKNYGILWDNYSITKVGDTRAYQQLSALKLYSANGDEGWLTASYVHKQDTTREIIRRPESVIDYEYLNDQKKFPDSLNLADAVVRWEGSIESGYSGTHHFLLKYGGYVKVWIDDMLVADRWRQAWNPCTIDIPVTLEMKKKYKFKIEWNPDGGQSYIGLKWLNPLDKNNESEFGFRSEAGNEINYYFVAGRDMDDVISGYRSLTGRATLVPKWAMGFWQSRERYKTQDEILSVVSEFRKRQIPLDNIVLDWSYWEQDKWGSQDFDATRFPDPAAMIKTLHEKYNTNFMISVWPKFYEGIQTYKDFDDKGFLYKRNIANRQRDWIAQGYVNTFYDAFNPKAREAFWDLINKKIYSKGVDAWWLDASEPDIHSNLNIESRKEQMTPTALGPATKFFNGFPLQNAKAIYEGQRKTDPAKRVFILTRSGYAGSQRYAVSIWSGDIAARWEDFKNQIPAGINFSLSGLPYWTTDIGGFAVEKRYTNAKGNDLEEWRELSTRWYQFGAFCPLFRVHGQFPYREIFNIAPEDHPAYKSMLYYDKLRYRLMPYIYSIAGKTYHNDYTIMRGLVMDFPSDTTVRNIKDQYMFGPAILVSPVTDFKARIRDLYLPSSTGWYNFYSGKYFNGGQQVKEDAPLERIPLFIKEGSIVPFGPALQYTSQRPADNITLFVYTGKNADFTLYEDENLNYNYENGSFSTISFNYDESSKLLTIEAPKGSFPGMINKRTFKIIRVSKDKPVAMDADAVGKTVNYSGKAITVKLN